MVLVAEWVCPPMNLDLSTCMMNGVAGRVSMSAYRSWPIYLYVEWRGWQSEYVCLRTLTYLLAWWMVWLAEWLCLPKDLDLATVEWCGWQSEFVWLRTLTWLLSLGGLVYNIFIHTHIKYVKNSGAKISLFFITFPIGHCILSPTSSDMSIPTVKCTCDNKDEMPLYHLYFNKLLFICLLFTMAYMIYYIFELIHVNIDKSSCKK